MCCCSGVRVQARTHLAPTPDLVKSGAIKGDKWRHSKDQSVCVLQTKSVCQNVKIRKAIIISFTDSHFCVLSYELTDRQRRGNGVRERFMNELQHSDLVPGTGRDTLTVEGRGGGMRVRVGEVMECREQYRGMVGRWKCGWDGKRGRRG